MFRVEWNETALEELAALWVEADARQRQALTAASHELDRRLLSNPREEGESRYGDQRITFIPPLVVAFEIEPATQSVLVLHVRMIPRRA